MAEDRAPFAVQQAAAHYTNEVPDGNAQSMWDMEIWACSDKGRKALDKVASETLEEGEP